LLLVPSFAFPPSAIIKRKPLSSTARRAGWVGCNFALNRIPADARIAVVTTVAKRGTGILPVSVSKTDAAQGEHRLEACATLITPPEEVRERFKRVKPLGEIKAKERGWTLDVLNAIRRLVESRRRGDETPSEKSEIDQSLLTSSPTGEFTTADAYIFERELEQLHPDNRNIKAKIRQQLQELRDRNLLLHIGRNCWRLPQD